MSPADLTPERFERLCFFEDWYFRSVTAAAGPSGIPSLDQWDGARFAPRVTGRVFRSDDGRRLAGFHIKATRASKGFVLVAHGNAMLAEHIVLALTSIKSAELDVVLYDDRGYGRSEGTTRFLAIFADARAIFRQLTAEIGGHGFGYGLSQGGIVLANALLSDMQNVRGVVIDGTPGDLPWYLCSSGFDPAHRVMTATLPGPALMVISGGRDQVISRNWMQALIGAAQERGAKVILRDDFSHPFQEPSELMLKERLNLIWGFFEERRNAKI